MRRRIFIRQLITEIAFFALIHTLLSAGLSAFYADVGPAFLSLLLLIPYFGMYAARATGYLPVFLAAHVGLAVWPLLMPSLWNISALNPAAPLAYMLQDFPPESITPLNACWTAVLVIFAIRSIALRLRPQRGGFDIGYLVFCCALYAAAAAAVEYIGLRGLTRVVSVWAFLSIAGYLIYAQTIRVDSSIAILSEAGKKPVAEIRRFNNAILAVFLVPVTLFALLSPWLPLGRAASLLGAASLAALRGIFRFIRWLMSLFPQEDEAAVSEMPATAPDMSAFADEIPETPAWVEFLETLFLLLINIAIVGAIAAAIAYGLYRLYKRFYATAAKKSGDDADGDTRTYIGPKLVQIPLAEAARGLLRVFAPKTEEEKTRRQYFKKVRRHIRRGAAVRRTDTAGEIAVKINPAEDIGELTERYERARYGTPGQNTVHRQTNNL